MNRSFANPIVIMAVCFGLGSGMGSSCSRGTRQIPLESDGSLLSERREKDLSYKSSDNSPLLPADRGRFQKLAYYDINPALRFRLKLNRYPNPKTIRAGTNTGEVRSGLRYGYFEFQVHGITCRLQVYRLEDIPGSGGGADLFMPFRDATSGRTTYGAGRYLDLKENTSGFYDLDFNRAYNPLCAYNSGYSCPIPPPENTLPVSVEAGEKMYPLKTND